MSHPAKLDRAAIVAAGMELLASGGLRGLSLRAIAAALDVAPNALYHHLADREDLERMLAAEVSERLHAALRPRIHSQVQTAQDALRTLAVEYMRFAREHRLVYEALLVPRRAGGDDARGPEQLWLFVLGVVGRVSGRAAAHEATVALWAFLHGMASLQSVDAFNNEKPFASFDYGLNAWMRAAEEARSAEEAIARGKLKSAGKRVGARQRR